MENRRFDTKALIEASILSAITAVFILLNVSVPLFFMIATFVIPIPIVIIYVRYGYKVAILSVIITYIILMFFGLPVEAIFQIVNGILPAMVLGYCIKKGKPAITTILYLTVATLAAAAIYGLLAAVFILPGISNSIQNFINSQIELMKSSTIQVRDLYKAMGVGENDIELMNKIIEQINLNLFLSIMPALIVFSTFITSFAMYIVTGKILLRLKIKTNKLRSLTTLYINNMVGAVMIVLLCTGLLLEELGGILAGRYIASFIFIIGAFALLVTGCSLLAYFLRVKFKLSKGRVIFIVILSFILQLAPFYIGLGLTDMIMDVRRLDPNRIFKS